jgi:rhodanese-related sulfurtransferase
LGLRGGEGGEGDCKTDESTIETTTTIPNLLDMKYCRLRKDLSIESQLFDSLQVKVTQTVISLFDQQYYLEEEEATTKKKKTHCSRYQRRKEKRKQQQQQQVEEEEQQQQQQPTPSPSLLDYKSLRHEVMEKPLRPSQHLSPSEWNTKLDSLTNDNDALLLDVRNVYESRVGYFTHPKTPTLLTNTRKYSDLPTMLATNSVVKEKQKIFMYCTGGVRCERVSMLVQQLYPQKQVYQLQGGIQTYLHSCAQQDQGQQPPDKEDDNSKEVETTTTTTTTTTNDIPLQQKYFVGKNFVSTHKSTPRPSS